MKFFIIVGFLFFHCYAVCAVKPSLKSTPKPAVKSMMPPAAKPAENMCADLSDMQAFSKRFVPNQSASFHDYYKKKLTRIGSYSEAKKRKKVAAMRATGKSALEVKEPALFKQLKACDDAAANKVLMRYGILQEFECAQAKKPARIWHRFTEYSKHMGKKVTGLFKSKQQPMA